MSANVEQVVNEVAAAFYGAGVFAPASDEINDTGEDFSATRFEPEAFIRARLRWEPWRGTPNRPGQCEVIDAYELALRQQHERRDWERGELRYEGGEAVRVIDGVEVREPARWQPGQIIQNWISVDAGHTVGKTTVAAGLVLHFFCHFSPSVTYCFAPSAEQINDLLFKEIRKQHKNKGLPGKVLDTPRINFKEDHFVKGKATNNDSNTGTERTHGQHEEYLLFVLDEAEGIQPFVFEAVESMASGGIVIVLIFRNPRTTVCQAHKVRREAHTKALRISCLDHPNVREDREVVPGAVRRNYVEDMLAKCEIVPVHSEEDFTFTVPWRPGVIYRPSLTCLWRVLGRASSKGTDDTFCPPDRYEAACEREPYPGDDPEEARIGVDSARYGNDTGTVYVRHAGRVWKDGEIKRQDGYAYYIGVKETCRRLKEKGVKRIKVRMDAGGGYHSTACDNLRRDADLQEWFEVFEVLEVHNNAPAHDPDKYADLVTEMYFYGAEALKALRLDSPSSNLEQDLCERKFKYVIKTVEGKTRLDLKQLVSKEKFKDDFHRSPDDGDGFVLAVGPDCLFVKPKEDRAIHIFRRGR